MIAALARAAVVLSRPDWLALAKTAHDFVETHMQTADGRLLHAYRSGRTTAAGTAADYANMIHAAVRLHQATGDARYLETARRWITAIDKHHWLPEPGGYATTADDTKDVIVRMLVANDDAVPNANGTMLSALVALFTLTGDGKYLERAEQIPRAFGSALAASLVGHCGMVGAMMDLAAPKLIAICGEDLPLRNTLLGLSLPGAVEVFLPVGATGAAGSPISGKSTIDGKPTLYACLGPSCSLPMTEPALARETLMRLRRPQPNS